MRHPLDIGVLRPVPLVAADAQPDTGLLHALRAQPAANPYQATPPTTSTTVPPAQQQAATQVGAGVQGIYDTMRRLAYAQPGNTPVNQSTANSFMGGLTGVKPAASYNPGGTWENATPIAAATVGPGDLENVNAQVAQKYEYDPRTGTYRLRRPANYPSQTP